MAARKAKKKSPHPLAFVTTVGVRLNRADSDDLTECARLEGELRNEIVHEATLYRELGIPAVRARLKELQTQSVRAEDDRRTGDERRAPALVESR